MTTPALIAHRGYTLHYPENTLAAIEAAIATGARYVEVDVQLSRDLVPVLFHDRTLDRLCGMPGAIHEHSLAELERLRASDFSRFGYRFAREPIPTLATLAACLARHPEVTAFVELKRVSLAQFGTGRVVARVLTELDAVRAQCVLISYDVPALATARTQGFARVGAVVDRWRERLNPALRALAPEYLFCDVEGLPRLGMLGFGNARLAVFEVASPERALKLAARGVAFIETFAIGEMRAGLELRTGTPTTS